MADVKDIIQDADAISSLLKAGVLSAGSLTAVVLGIIWVIKRFTGAFVSHHENISKHQEGREGALDAKENIIFGAVQEDRKQAFTLLSEVVKLSAETSVTLKVISDGIAKHNESLEKHTGFLDKLTQQIDLRNEELIARVHNGFENAFANYVHLIQTHPEIAKKILAERNNPISAVIDEMAKNTPLTFDVEPPGSSLPPNEQPAGQRGRLDTRQPPA